MREYCKEKIKNLIALRTNLFTTVIILTGGIFGLFFIHIPIGKLVFFFAIGGYFDILFLSNLISTNKYISELLEELK